MFFMGFAFGLVIWIVWDAVVNRHTGDVEMFSGSVLAAIYILFVSFFAFFYAAGGFLGSLMTPIDVTSRRFWLLNFLLGTVSALVVVLVMVLAGSGVLGVFEVVGMFGSGLLSALLMRPIGMFFCWSRKWYPPGCCPACGYDLRVTPAGEPCPECGEARPGPD